MYNPFLNKNEGDTFTYYMLGQFGHFDKQSSTTIEINFAPQGKISGFFSWKLLKIVF